MLFLSAQHSIKHAIKQPNLANKPDSNQKPLTTYLIGTKVTLYYGFLIEWRLYKNNPNQQA